MWNACSAPTQYNKSRKKRQIKRAFNDRKRIDLCLLKTMTPQCLWMCVCAPLPRAHLHSTLQSFLLQLPLSPIVSDTPQMPEVFGLMAPPPLWMGIWPFDKPSFIKTSAPSTHLPVDRSQPPSFFIWRQPPRARSPGLPSCQSSTLLRSRVILMATKRTHRVPLFKPDPRTG